MGQLLGSIAVALVLAGWVARDVLIDHGRIVRGLEERGAPPLEPDTSEPAVAPWAAHPAGPASGSAR